MSATHQATRHFVMLPIDALDGAGLTYSAYRVFAAVCSHVGPDGRSWPGQETLAAEARVNRNDVSRLIREAVRAGRMALDGWHTNGNGIRTRRYRVFGLSRPEARPEALVAEEIECSADTAFEAAAPSPPPGESSVQPNSNAAPTLHKETKEERKGEGPLKPPRENAAPLADNFAREGVAAAPVPEPTPEPVQPEKSRRLPRGTYLPANWDPGAEGYRCAEDLGLDPNQVLKKFRNHYRGKLGIYARSCDWQARWQDWCRVADEQARRDHWRDRRSAAPAGASMEELRERWIAMPAEHAAQEAHRAEQAARIAELQAGYNARMAARAAA